LLNVDTVVLWGEQQLPMEILSSGIWRILVKAPLTDGALQAFSWVSRVRMYKSIDHGFDAFKILQ
jgi:hypothetical protein